MAVASFRPPAITCAELLAYAAKDDALLYLSLLPREIRDFIDPLIRWSAWRAGGEFIPCPIQLPIPGDPLAHSSNEVGSFERIVLPNGDEVYHSQQHYMKIKQSQMPHTCKVTLDGHALAITFPDTIALRCWGALSPMCFEIKQTRIAAYSADGALLGELIENIPSHFAHEVDLYSSFQLTSPCGWVRVGDILHRVPKFDRRFPIPAKNVSPHKWVVAGPEGKEKFAHILAKSEVWIWDLSTGVQEHQIVRPGVPTLVAKFGVVYFVDKSTDRTELYSLTTGTLLVTLPFTTIMVTAHSIVSHTSRALYYWNLEEPDRMHEISLKEFELRATWNKQNEPSGAVYRTRDGTDMQMFIDFGSGKATTSSVPYPRSTFSNVLFHSDTVFYAVISKTGEQQFCMLPLYDIPSHGYPETATPYVLHHAQSAYKKAEFVRPQGCTDRCGPVLALDGQLMVLSMKKGE